eukprot:Gb_39128 [translate_table: standard]
MEISLQDVMGICARLRCHIFAFMKKKTVIDVIWIRVRMKCQMFRMCSNYWLPQNLKVASVRSNLKTKLEHCLDLALLLRRTCGNRKYNILRSLSPHATAGAELTWMLLSNEGDHSLVGL